MEETQTSKQRLFLMRSFTTFFLAIFSVKNFVFFILFRDPAEGSPIMATRGLSDQIWVVTVPNGQEADQTTLASLAKGTQDRGLCRLHKFEVPSLHHGTLDSLIALSDDLGKMNQQVEVSKQWRFFYYPARVFAPAFRCILPPSTSSGRGLSRQVATHWLLHMCPETLDLETNHLPSFFLLPPFRVSFAR